MDTLAAWVTGHLSPSARIWTALAPALILFGYFVVSLVIYLFVAARRGPYSDGEIEHRGSSVLLGMPLRRYFAWSMRPILRLVLATGVPASALTTLSVLLSVGSGISVASGRFALGGWLYIFGGILDYFDGRVARSRGQDSSWGAALDSILDRYSDSAILVGMAWFYRDHWALLVVLLALVGTHLVPYIRAKGESLGVMVKVGVMQRAERIAYLGVLVALSPILEATAAPAERSIHSLAVAGIVLLAASTQVTALQRLFFLLRSLNPKPSVTRLLPVRQRNRNFAAAMGATMLDFSVLLMLVEVGGAGPVLATAAGTMVGASLHFALLRLWIFERKSPRLPHPSRYVFVSLTSTFLNTGGVALLLTLPNMPYLIAWPIIRLGVYATWSLPLKRTYLFAPIHAATDTAPICKAGPHKP